MYCVSQGFVTLGRVIKGLFKQRIQKMLEVLKKTLPTVRNNQISHLSIVDIKTIYFLYHINKNKYLHAIN